MDRPAHRHLSATPPMGWNSWDCYGTTVTEREVVANAEFMATRLLPHGWNTVVVDIQWHEPSRLTWDEQRTLMTLWCMARSPLMYGGDLPTSDPRTLELLTNDDVLGVLNHSRDNRQVTRESDRVVWTAEATDREGRYLALFNIGDAPLRTDLPLSLAGVPAGGRAVDLWTGEDIGELDRSLIMTLRPNGCVLVRVTPGRG